MNPSLSVFNETDCDRLQDDLEAIINDCSLQDDIAYAMTCTRVEPDKHPYAMHGNIKITVRE